MRQINKIIIHCSASPCGQNYTIQSIDTCHRRRGFRSIGYHFVIYPDGSIHEGRPLQQIGAHCLGHNADSIGICYIGGLDSHGRPKDTRTHEQILALQSLVRRLKESFPNASVHGHNEFAAKACPCFNVKTDPSLCDI